MNRIVFSDKDQAVSERTRRGSATKISHDINARKPWYQGLTSQV
jgi:hypothetical protein